MGDRRRPAAFDLLAVLLWSLAIWGFAASPPSPPGVLLLGCAFAVTTIVFTVLRVRVGRFDVSSGAVIGYLSVAVLGPRAAALIKLATGPGMAWDNGRGQAGRRTALRWFVYQAPTAMLMVLCAGWVYRAAGGMVAVSGPRAGVRWIVPYFLMESAYTLVNVGVLSLQAAVKEWRSPLPILQDLLRRTGVSVGVFAVIGVVLQSLYDQLGPISLAFMLLLLLLARSVVRLAAANQEVVSEMAAILARVLRLRDPYTGDHSARVAELSVRIGRALGLDDGELERVRDSALVHDIGKVAVPDAVLRKPGPLDSEEWASMDRHVLAAGEVLEHAPHLRQLAACVRHHHADFSAETTGAVASVPLAARIIAVADAYDAMTSDRPYRRALPVEEAVRRLRAGSGSQFDPECVRGLLRVLGVADDEQPLPGAEHGSALA
jgi:hypothetical protein